MPDPINPHPNTPTVFTIRHRQNATTKTRKLEGRTKKTNAFLSRVFLPSSSRYVFLYSCSNVVARLARAERAADFLRAVARDDRVADGGLDRRGFNGPTGVVEHQGGGQDCAHRVRDVLACERQRRSVDRLEHRGLARMEVSRRRQAEAALQRGAEVGDDVAEEIVRDDDVELRGA